MRGISTTPRVMSPTSKMAAGTVVTFLISNSYDGDYKTSAGLAFQGFLDSVSTDNMENGF